MKAQFLPPMTLVTLSGQILLEPAVIQDVLSAGSHLQLLELLSLCSHYLIQVHTLTHTAQLIHNLGPRPAIESQYHHEGKFCCHDSNWILDN